MDRLKKIFLLAAVSMALVMTFGFGVTMDTAHAVDDECFNLGATETCSTNRLCNTGPQLCTSDTGRSLWGDCGELSAVVGPETEEDVFAMTNGTNVLRGRNGADHICDGNGSSTIEGGAGADTIDGRGGLDTIDGGAGADFIEAGDGNDRVSGGAGRDEIHGQDNNDRIAGNAGNDIIEGGDNDDILNGNAANDDLEGDDDVDTLFGDEGNDDCDEGDGPGTEIDCNP